jgi:hypothetical protein
VRTKKRRSQRDALEPSHDPASGLYRFSQPRVCLICFVMRASVASSSTMRARSTLSVARVPSELLAPPPTGAGSTAAVAAVPAAAAMCPD